MILSCNIDPWAEQFPEDFVPEVCRLILDSWRSFIIPSDIHEVPITRYFCAHLRNNKNRSKLPFSIQPESQELDESGRELGRIDLKFQHGHDEAVYFSFECKRLRVTLPSGFRTLSNEYVTEGMYRYFNGQYATGLDKGGMLGYVLDGDINNALNDIQLAIDNRVTELYMHKNPKLQNCTILSSPHVKETLHEYGTKSEFIVYHIFVSCLN